MVHKSWRLPKPEHPGHMTSIRGPIPSACGAPSGHGCGWGGAAALSSSPASVAPNDAADVLLEQHGVAVSCLALVRGGAREPWFTRFESCPQPVPNSPRRHPRRHADQGRRNDAEETGRSRSLTTTAPPPSVYLHGRGYRHPCKPGGCLAPTFANPTTRRILLSDP